jgi:hypothetical protein
MKKILIIFFLFITACGYQPLFTTKDPNNFTFKKIELTGDKKINNKIVSALSLKENSTNNSLNDITLESKKEIKATSKNSKGQTTSFKSTVSLTATVIFKGKSVKKKVFVKDFSYNNLKNKFNLSEYQDQIEDNLTEKIIEELIIFINL